MAKGLHFVFLTLALLVGVSSGRLLNGLSLNPEILKSGVFQLPIQRSNDYVDYSPNNARRDILIDIPDKDHEVIIDVPVGPAGVDIEIHKITFENNFDDDYESKPQPVAYLVKPEDGLQQFPEKGF